MSTIIILKDEMLKKLKQITVQQNAIRLNVKMTSSHQKAKTEVNKKKGIFISLPTTKGGFIIMRRCTMCFGLWTKVGGSITDVNIRKWMGIITDQRKN